MKSVRILKKQLESLCGRVDEICIINSEKKCKKLLQEIETTFGHYCATAEESMSDEELQTVFTVMEKLVFESKMKLVSAIDTAETVNSQVDDKSFDQFLQSQQKLIEGLSSVHPVNMGEIRLPQINVQPFSGEYYDWPRFHDIYMSTIHDNTRLTPIQKFQYLKTLMIKEPASLMGSIPVTEDNYLLAWKQLNERYNRPLFIVRAVIDRFMNVEPANGKQSSFNKVVSVFSETINVLDNLGDSYSKSRDPWVIMLILSKLDNDTRRAWCEFSSSAERQVELKDMLSFLESRRSATELFNSESNIVKKASFRAYTALKDSCFYCKENHNIWKCSKFLDLIVEEREKIIVKESRCFNCLAKGHSVKQCKSLRTCQKCGRKHNSLLHRENKFNNNGKSDNVKQSTQIPNSETTVRLNACYGSGTESLLPTAIVEIYDAFGVKRKCRVLLDSGAQASFISEKCLNELQLRRCQSRVPIKGLLGAQNCYSRGKISLLLHSLAKEDKTVSATLHVLPSLIEGLPAPRTSLLCFSELNEMFEIADTSSGESPEIDIILSAAKFMESLEPGKYFNKIDKVFIQNTVFGFVICSQDSENSTSEYQVNNVLLSEDERLDNILERFWEMEEVKSDEQYQAIEDSECLENFKSTVVHLENGHFSVDLPFRKNRERLGESYNMAMKRFNYLEKRFEKDISFKNEYLAFMSNYKSSGHMEEFSLMEGLSKEHYFLPHHGIWKQSVNKRKLRVVFDASAPTSNGVSLNDILMTGPNIQRDICKVMTLFRYHHRVFSCDIEQMYRQIFVNPEHLNYQLILWRESVRNPVECFRLLTVTYGTKPAPFLALSVVDELFSKYSDDFPHLVSVVKDRIYMDDINVGSDDLEGLLEMKNDLVLLMSFGGFKLKKWASNDRKFLETIKESDLADSDLKIFGQDSTIKTLGMYWNTSEDSLGIRLELQEIDHYTKRSLLSETARLYDPLGWCSPIIVSMKLMFQETWSRKLGWDESLPSDINEKILKIKDQLRQLEVISVKRWFNYRSGDQVELVGFSDASIKAYAAVLYLRVMRDNQPISVNLVVSKTKVSPLKAVSIARLELCAAQLLSKLVKQYRPCFELLSPRYYLYTDSTTVLAWLNSPPKRWTTFVANRVQSINDLCPKIKWRYVSSKDNPADIASRGIEPLKLIETPNWWYGPGWLMHNLFEDLEKCEFLTTEDERAERVCAVHNFSNKICDFIERFSDYNRMIRVNAYCLRFVNNLRHERAHGSLSLREIQNSTITLIKQLQICYFSNEYDLLCNKKQLNRASRIFKLSPLLGDDGLIRIGGRLHNLNASENEKHKIILPNCHFVVLMIDKLHRENFHANQNVILGLIQKDYHVVSLRNLVKSSIRKCLQCKRYNANCYNPEMGPLPKERLIGTKAFLNVGMDFAGPLLLRPLKGRGRIVTKGYICVIICLATKAIHLELVMDLTTNALKLALQRFISRRGHCQTISSDNGKNFVGCSREFKSIASYINKCVEDDQIKKFLCGKLIEWKFIPPYSPHMGGIWEAGVKSVKMHLQRGFGDQRLSIEEAITALCQIEIMLNSRPLIPITKDTASGDILTPNHFIFGDSGFPLLTTELLDDVKEHRERYTRIQSLMSGFWKTWKNDYLNVLNQKSKWVISKGQSPKVGDLVLIKRSMSLPAYWPKGVIDAVYPGKDGVIRIVDVRTNAGRRTEAIRNLIPLCF